MQTKDILMFATVAILVGTIVSMTTAGVAAAQTVNSGNNDNNNINTDTCQVINPVVASNNENGGTDDADEPGDTDVNDEEDTDTGNEDAGEANDDEEEETGATDDADEPGDTDVNDEEDTDTGSEDAGEGTTELASEVRSHIEGACMALQNNDIQGALMHVDLALNMLGSNTPTSVGFSNAIVDNSNLSFLFWSHIFRLAMASLTSGV